MRCKPVRTILSQSLGHDEEDRRAAVVTVPKEVAIQKLQLAVETSVARTGREYEGQHDGGGYFYAADLQTDSVEG